jgi:hypothetical protein
MGAARGNLKLLRRVCGVGAPWSARGRRGHRGACSALACAAARIARSRCPAMPRLSIVIMESSHI